ncbi:MAG: glycoside hydrolase superfamily [Linnemannia elongata]|nr:MAG: glycoside hydrolase superfamily [Linnemannia elongata]
MKITNFIASVALALTLSLPVITHAERVVGYYGQTAGGASCSDYPPFDPSDLPIDLYTHLNFAFALIDDSGLIANQETMEILKYQLVNDLKKKKPSLRTAVTVGGWDMNMAHYSTMVSTRENRQKFIRSAMAFVRKYGFDGLDFDWEYPGDPKRGGNAQDPENFVQFLKEMREAANAEVLENGQDRLILSIALPGGPFHGDNFLIPKLDPHVDWFNIMAYNLHGQLESLVFCAAPLNDPASDTEYNGYSLIQAIQSMAPSTVNPQKFNIGLSLSGVTFTLKNPSLTTPGAPAHGPGKKGCQEKGAMSYFEASKLMDLFGAKSGAVDTFQRKITQAPRLDEKSQCVYMVVDQDQWVGIDTPETFTNKVDYFRKFGFGGVSIWSMDSDTVDHRLTRSISKAISGSGPAPSSTFVGSGDKTSGSHGNSTSSRPNNVGKVVGVLPDQPISQSTGTAGRGQNIRHLMINAVAAIVITPVVGALFA